MNNTSISIKIYKISIVIPTYNAAGTIKHLVNSLEKFSNDFQMTIILIDDCSVDDTTTIIESLANDYSNIKYCFSDKNKGQQASLQAGLKLVNPGCDFVLTMDDDLQNPVEYVVPLINEILQGFDLVYAIPLISNSNTKGNLSYIRKFGSHLRNLLFDSFKYKPNNIKVSAFRIMTYELAMKISNSKKRYFYMSAEAFQYKINVSNIFYPSAPRYCGKSSYNFSRLITVYLRLLFTYKFDILKWVKK